MCVRAGGSAKGLVPGKTTKRDLWRRTSAQTPSRVLGAPSTSPRCSPVAISSGYSGRFTSVGYTPMHYTRVSAAPAGHGHVLTEAPLSHRASCSDVSTERSHDAPFGAHLCSHENLTMIRLLHLRELLDDLDELLDFERLDVFLPEISSCEGVMYKTGETGTTRSVEQCVKRRCEGRH